MKINEEKLCIFIMICVVLTFCCAVATAFVVFGNKKYDEGYKAACTDFYNGKLKYEPVKREIIEWKKKGD